MASARLIRRASSQPNNDDYERTPLLSGSGTDEGETNAGEPDVDSDLEDNDPAAGTQHFTPNPFADLPVYTSIWRVRRDVLDAINDPYSFEQLKSPRLNTAIVRPLLDKYHALNDISIVFCLLANRVQFLRDNDYQTHNTSVRVTRALLCELLALRLLRQFDVDSSGPDGLLLLANIIIAGFDPFQGAPTHVTKNSRAFQWAMQDRGGYERHLTSLEMAIVSESKLFLSSTACQKVVDAIYAGRIIYTPNSFVDILPDHYKNKPISIYNPRKASLLNTYRLAVPRIRNIMEIAQFVMLLILYLWLMATKDPARVGIEESIFIIYTIGWVIDQLASVLEHGWAVYSQNLWSFLDVTFCAIFAVYFMLRMQGVSTGRIHISQPALDLLALGAPFLVPRLAFNIFSENLLFVSLRDMMSKFLLLMVLAIWSFAGFFLAMVWLDFNDKTTPVSAVTTGLWMVWVWFGLDGTGISHSVEFHWLLGPIVMISFAILGNTLFLTLLVSTLSESFAKIARHANGEIQFRRAVLTFEGVKSDAIFSYPPPFNLLALLIMLPLKLVLTPRWFHKVNITFIRALNFPFLVGIGLWERRYLWPKDRKTGLGQPRDTWWDKIRAWSEVPWIHAHGDIQAVFEAPPDDFIDDSLESSFAARRRKSLKACAPDAMADSVAEAMAAGRDKDRDKDLDGDGTVRRRSRSRPLPTTGFSHSSRLRLAATAAVHARRGSGPSTPQRQLSNPPPASRAGATSPGPGSGTATPGGGAGSVAVAAATDQTSTETRLERIEELLEQIGQSLDNGEDNDG